MKKMKKVYLLINISGLLIFGSCNGNSTNNHDKGSEPRVDASTSNINESDNQFLIDAAQVNMDEIQLGKMAQEKGSTDVKDLGKMMEGEHSLALNDVKQLATKKQIPLPSNVTGKENQHYKILSGKAGIEFDTEYCKIMIQGHKETIEKFEREISIGKDPDIKALASNILPKLKMHLEHSLTCQQKISPEL